MYIQHRVSTRPGPIGKIESQTLQTFPFVPSNMEDNVELINFLIKCRSVQGLVFLPKTFDKCNKNFYFENGEIGMKTTNTSL